MTVSSGFGRTRAFGPRDISRRRDRGRRSWSGIGSSFLASISDGSALPPRSRQRIFPGPRRHD
jgi:hypothetical protein